jgi:hypothetical protein
VSFFLSPGAPWAGAIAIFLGFFLALSDAGDTTQGLGVLAVIAGFAVFAISSSMRASEALRQAEAEAYERGRRDAMAELEKAEDRARERL